MRFEIENIDSIFNNKENHSNIFNSGLSYLHQFIYNYLSLKIDINFKPYIDLIITNQNTVFVYRIRTLLEPICNILNINYIPVKDSSELDYYRIEIESKIVELRNIKTIEEFQYKFPYIYSKYEELVKDTKVLLNAYATYQAVYPKKQAEILLKKEIFCNGYTFQYFLDIINGASSLCFQRVIKEYEFDLSKIHSSLNILQNELNRIIIDANNIVDLNINEYKRKIKKQV